MRDGSASCLLSQQWAPVKTNCVEFVIHVCPTRVQNHFEPANWSGLSVTKPKPVGTDGDMRWKNQSRRNTICAYTCVRHNQFLSVVTDTAVFQQRGLKCLVAHTCTHLAMTPTCETSLRHIPFSQVSHTVVVLVMLESVNWC